MRRVISYALVVLKWLFVLWIMLTSNAAVLGITIQETVRRIADRFLVGGILLAVAVVGVGIWSEKEWEARASRKKT